MTDWVQILLCNSARLRSLSPLPNQIILAAEIQLAGFLGGARDPNRSRHSTPGPKPSPDLTLALTLTLSLSLSLTLTRRATQTA